MQYRNKHTGIILTAPNALCAQMLAANPDYIPVQPAASSEKPAARKSRGGAAHDRNGG